MAETCRFVDGSPSVPSPSPSRKRDYGMGVSPTGCEFVRSMDRMKKNRARGSDSRNGGEGIQMNSEISKAPSPGWHAWSDEWTRQDDYTGRLYVKTVPPIPDANRPNGLRCRPGRARRLARVPANPLDDCGSAAAMKVFTKD